MEANNLNQVPNKVSFAKKIGYSIGGATDTLAYDFVAAFLLFFLTNFTGVSPAWAGAILTIGVIWNMFSDPIVGNLSDRTRTRFGKREHGFSSLSYRYSFHICFCSLRSADFHQELQTFTSCA